MSPPILPPARPKLEQSAATRIAKEFGVTSPVALLGVRGYYRDTMGRPGENDRGIYDDAMFVISPTAFAAFNANTDPSITRKHVAVLMPGVWRYKKGRHPFIGGYAAFRQAAHVTVARDEEGLDTGDFGINIHKGSRTTTSSRGCQTIWPDQWEAFRALAYAEMDRYRQATIPYVLVLESALRT